MRDERTIKLLYAKGRIVLLIEQSKNDIEDALEAWDWFDFSGKSPFITTAFGDVFFESEDGIYFLDSLGGTLDKVTDSKLQLQEILNTQDGQDHYLMSGLVVAARESGLTLEEGECYDFKVSPALNGTLELSNLQKMSFKVSLHISGQLTKQIKDLPPGTKINGVEFEGA
ncbi:T6SS immunity protein Tdi1 domain-containing protein [Pseudoalteromonas distincta]|mgnify:CR=1 FL=1|uniref:T6SS immunity protein Tdi1 domain-containing protein n=1 Tax=Pseudoalteromonas distincta TaxID=77608 RepID=UPI00321890A6|tara:strand:+ start:461 stop:970 length:510 start_codon:yes stop_codon:yes gene_type:complete